jgi:hypothetical protein
MTIGKTRVRASKAKSKSHKQVAKELADALRMAILAIEHHENMIRQMGGSSTTSALMKRTLAEYDKNNPVEPSPTFSTRYHRDDCACSECKDGAYR